MPDNNSNRPGSGHQDDGVEETVHAGCGLPIIILLIGLIFTAVK